MSVQHPAHYKDVPAWQLSDSFWERIKPLLPKPKSRLRGRGQYRRHIGGRPPADRRQVMAGILYVLRTGCQWNAAPKEFGSGKTLHRYFQHWSRARVFKRMWRAGLQEYDEVKGLEWKWQAADGAITKAPLGGQATGKSPVDRAKCGTKRSLLVEAKGVPLALEVGPANRHDVKMLAATLDGIVVERPEPSEQARQNLCLDKGYAGEPSRQEGQARGYEVHVPDKVNAKQKRKRKGGRRKARRWVVEVTHSWLNRFRRLLVRWEKKKANYLSMLYFACAIICWRKCEV
ncbi:MAG: putative transposase [Blastocatellia bacterium]